MEVLTEWGVCVVFVNPVSLTKMMKWVVAEIGNCSI